jgi:hypothetical protein
MVTTYVGMFFGLLLGFALGGPLGAALGVFLGFAMGMMIASVPKTVCQAAPGATLVREEHRLLCMPKGQVATATFVRDVEQSRWLDVERCTLCEPEEKVGCAKRCLTLMRDTLPSRKNPVQAREPAHC